MINRDKAAKLAQAEVDAKTWGVTRQLLAINNVARKATGEPLVVRVDEASEPDSYLCYFAVQDKPYYFVVYVQSDKDGQLSISGSNMAAGVRVYLLIASKTMTPDEITAAVGLSPTKTYFAGQPVKDKFPDRRYKETGWILEPQAETPGSVEEKLKTILSHVESKAKQIASLKPICEVHINIVYKGWGGDVQFGGYHFDESIMGRLCSLGAELDFDLYAYGPEMPDDQ